MIYKPMLKKTSWQEVACIGMAGLLGLMAVMVLCSTNVFAGGNGAGGTMFELVFTIITRVIMIIGVLLGIVGVAKFAISHADGQGADQHKAILMMATGIILVILPLILDPFKSQLAAIITSATNP